jgi:hypothetical protein
MFLLILLFHGFRIYKFSYYKTASMKLTNYANFYDSHWCSKV